MTPFVIALVIGAALLHAAWNAMLRSGSDRLWTIAVMNMTSAMAALPFALLLPLAERASWPCIGLSLLLQIGYCLFLERAYREGELSQVYPIARGAAPMLVTLGGATVAGERLTTIALIGVAIVSLGILTLAFERARPSAKTTVAAAITGVFIAAFTVTDGVGARLSDHAQSYTAWLFFLQGIAMPLVYVAIRGRLTITRRDPETLKAACAGLLALLSYGAIITALSISPMGQVSALRETSILFAAIIGVVFLKDTLTLCRIGGAGIIAVGAVVVSIGH